MTDSFLSLLSFFLSQPWVSALSVDFPEGYNPGDSLSENSEESLLSFFLFSSVQLPVFTLPALVFHEWCSTQHARHLQSAWRWHCDIFNNNIVNIGCVVLWISIGHSLHGISWRLSLVRPLLTCVSSDRASLKQHATLLPCLGLPYCL